MKALFYNDKLYQCVKSLNNFIPNHNAKKQQKQIKQKLKLIF